MAAPRIVIGSRVNVTNGPGVVRWLGTNPEFAAGSWVGVELWVGVGSQRDETGIGGSRHDLLIAALSRGA